MGQLRRRRKALIALAGCLLLAGAVTARLFVIPARGMPARVDAIVMLNGDGDRFDAALTLAKQHRAPFIVISRGAPQWGRGSDCAPKIPGEKIICFDPKPSTTRGEAEVVGRLARQYRWRSVVLITNTPQDSRARLRVRRCYPGAVYVMTVPPPWWSWPYQIGYEWAATVKAELFQRSC